MSETTRRWVRRIIVVWMGLLCATAVIDTVAKYRCEHGSEAWYRAEVEVHGSLIAMALNGLGLLYLKDD